MDAKEGQHLFLWIIEDYLRLSRHLTSTQQSLKLMLSSAGAVLPPALLQQLDSLLTAHHNDDLLLALSRAASLIRQKSEKGKSESA